MGQSKDYGCGKNHRRGASSNRGSSSRPPRQPSPHRWTANRPPRPPSFYRGFPNRPPHPPTRGRGRSSVYDAGAGSSRPYSRPNDPPRDSTAGSASQTGSEALISWFERYHYDIDDTSFSYGVMSSTDSSGETTSSCKILRMLISMSRHRSPIPSNIHPETRTIGVVSTIDIAGQAVQRSVQRYMEGEQNAIRHQQPPLDQSQRAIVQHLESVTLSESHLQNPILGESHRDERVLETHRSDSHSSEDSSGSQLADGWWFPWSMFIGFFV